MKSGSFILSIADKLVKFCQSQGYTQNQVENATPEQLFNKVNINPESDLARKYRFYEPVIKGHVINRLWPREMTASDILTGAVLESFPDAVITETQPGTFTVEVNQ